MKKYIVLIGLVLVLVCAMGANYNRRGIEPYTCPVARYEATQITWEADGGDNSSRTIDFNFNGEIKRIFIMVSPASSTSGVMPMFIRSGTSTITTKNASVTIVTHLNNAPIASTTLYFSGLNFYSLVTANDLTLSLGPDAAPTTASLTADVIIWYE